MDNIIIATFRDDTSATNGFEKLNELDKRGEILIYNQVLLRKLQDGRLEYLKTNAEARGWHAVAGMPIGGLMGLLGGPVGVVVGIIAGSVVGALAGMGRYSFDKAFIEKVTRDLPAGTTSIIAELSEMDTAVIDNLLESLGAEITRSSFQAERRQFIRSRIDI